MRPADIILLNAREVRRRSQIAWGGIPADSLQWKPDPAAMSAIEMVRHVLEGEHLYMLMAKERRTVSEDRSPFGGRPFASIDDEIAFAAPFHKEFEQTVASFADDDFEVLLLVLPLPHIAGQ